MSDETTSTPAAPAAPAPVVHAIPADRPVYAFNFCPSCGLVTRDAKFCPYCGPELQHVPALRKCSHCTEQIIFKDAKFCGWCGKGL